MYQTILVPLDGSTFAEAALPLALTLSRHAEARVHVVTVLEPVTSFAYEGWESAAEEWGRDYLDALVHRITDHAGGDVTSSLAHGHTVDSIHEESVGCDADVVVMASHGRGMLSRLWLGSVADGFVRHSERPVIVVRPEEGSEEAPETFDFAFGTLLVPLDGSELSEGALHYAVEFGDLFDSAYHLTRIVPFPFETSAYLPYTAQMNQATVDEAKRSAADYLEARADRLRKRGRSVTTSVAVDPQPGRGVLSEAAAVGADMIAMATHGRGGWRRAVLGSTADKVLRGTHMPLLLFRSPDQAD
jgi:nucleotide-binding universal stress UspA family protein